MEETKQKLNNNRELTRGTQVTKREREREREMGRTHCDTTQSHNKKLIRRKLLIKQTDEHHQKIRGIELRLLKKAFCDIHAGWQEWLV